MSRRHRGSRIELAPLLDVVFIMLLFYVANLVGREQQGEVKLSAAEEALEAQAAEAERLRDRALEELDQERLLRLERERQLDDLKRALRDQQLQLEALARRSSQSERRLDELRRANAQVFETRTLLDLVTRNFDVYTVTFYNGRRFELKTPRQDEYSLFATDVREVPDRIEELLPTDFDPTRAVFLIRSARGQSWIWVQTDFIPRARAKGWIFNVQPIEVDPSNGQ